MDYLLLMTLYGLEKIKGERTIYSIFHLFKGKRSSQTIQDAKLFQLGPLFGIIPDLTREKLEHVINQLANKGTITSIGEGSYTVTNSGRHELTSFSLPKSLDGWKYSGQSIVFWERLSLTIQCLSYLIHHETRFIPINRDQNTLQWVKWFLKNQSGSREIIARTLHEELLSLLTNLDETTSTIFVLKLSSIKRVGYTNAQISEMLHIDLLQVFILFQSTLHHVISNVEENPGKYPLLVQLATITDKANTLTQSTSKTLELLQKGKSIEEITAIRYLKKNTIEDHIVEIALTNPSFDITPFINTEYIKIISECIQSMKTNQLKVIKQNLPIEASYFEIRLVMAKQGGAHGTTSSIK
jgi:uncharacterized protein YpbB